MVKILISMIILSSFLNASAYEKNCLSCHDNYFKFNMMMKKYTVKYSSEKKIKKAIFDYLQNPSYETSVLPFGYLNRFGIKEESFLEDKVLKDMIDIYYKEFNLKNKIY